MATVQEWLAGTTANGKVLPHDRVKAMRARHAAIQANGGKLPAKKKTSDEFAVLPCSHRGGVLRQDVGNICGVRGKQVDILACAVHGECSLRRYCAKQTIKTCNNCEERAFVPLDETVRNMLYHIWPNQATDAWRWNVGQLTKRIESFNGVRSVAVVIDSGTASATEVVDAFGGARIDNWLIMKNNPNRREGATFLPLMETLPRDSGVSWYGHAKGVRHKKAGMTQTWAEALYKLTLDDWGAVSDSLSKHPITGAFRRQTDFKLPKHHVWHYSGTFFWFRNEAVFKKHDWHDIDPMFFASVEAWPARLFEASEAGCLFGDDAGNLYTEKEWSRWQTQLESRLAAAHATVEAAG